MSVIHVVYASRDDYLRRVDSELDAVRAQLQDIRADLRAKLARSVEDTMDRELFRILFG